MRIMIASIAPWASSGYGTQTAKLATSLKKDGHAVAITALFGLEGGVVDWHGITVFPRARDGMSAVLLAHIDFWKPDFVISLCDLWGIGGGVYGFPNFKWVSWLPVDHEPLAPFYKESLKSAWHVVSMSRHGERVLAEAGIKSTYIPHGVENGFHQDDTARKAWREAYGISKDTFVFGIVAMNSYWPSRKGFDRLLEAYKVVHDKYPNTLLFMHTTKQALSANYDLISVMGVMGIPEDSVRFTDEYPLFLGYDINNMRAMYNGFDCFVLPTQGEGFGLPVIEAQACGVPVIATDCTSMPELTQEDMRILVPAKQFMTLSYGYQFDINPEKLAEAMEKAYIQLKDECPCHAGTCDGWPWRRIVSIFAKNYDWDHVYAEYWRPFIGKLGLELQTPKGDISGDTACESYFVEVDGEKAIKKLDLGGYHGNLRQEAEILNTLSHTSIPEMLEYGKDEFGRNYMITRFCGNPITSEIIREHGNKIFSDVKNALEYLHSVGVVHRDVKLENIVWDGEKATLVDFGWAKYSTDPHPDYTATGDVTPGVARGFVKDTGLVALARILMPTDRLLKRIADSPSTGLPVPYHEMGLGVPAERDCQTRWDVMKPDVRGKTVLDIGCNMGWFVKKSLEEGAVNAVGIDHDPEIISVAKELVPDGDFYVVDLDYTNAIGRDTDIVFALSVIMHLKNPDKLWEMIDKVHANEVYFEPPKQGEYRENRDVVTWELELSKKWNARLCGLSDRDRPIFHLVRRTNG